MPTLELICWVEIFNCSPGGVAAIAFAGDVLRVASVERKIIFCRRSCAGARGKGKSPAGLVPGEQLGRRAPRLVLSKVLRLIARGAQVHVIRADRLWLRSARPRKAWKQLRDDLL